MIEHNGMLSSAIVELATRIGVVCEQRKLQVCTAESCTGGLVAGAITEVPGSSAWFSSGVVTYSNAAKHRLLGVEQSIFEEHGAVSEVCVVAMARGALERFGSDIAVSVSGIAGPGGATSGKPVGTVWMAWANRASRRSVSRQTAGYSKPDMSIIARCFQFDGSRTQVRSQAVEQVLRGILLQLD